MEIPLILKPVMNYVEMVETSVSMNAMTATELTLMAAMNTASKNNKAPRSTEQAPSSQKQLQSQTGMSVKVETKCQKTTAKITVETVKGTTTLISGNPDTTCSDSWKKSVMMGIT